jgi:hypothetical protein
VANVEAENPQPPAEVPAEAPATEPEAPAEVTGAPPIPTQPPVEGAPAEHEIVATPDAVARNDEFLAAQAAGGPAPAPVQTPPLPVPVGPGGAS